MVADGLLEACEDGWCLNGVPLELGPEDQLVATAAHDYDVDGVIETVAEELEGLTGTQVTLEVAETSLTVPGAEPGTEPVTVAMTVAMTVYGVNGLGYRNADGSFA